MDESFLIDKQSTSGLMGFTLRARSSILVIGVLITLLTPLGAMASRPPSLGGNGNPGEGEPPVTLSVVAGQMGARGWYVSPVTVTLNASDPDGSVVFSSYRLNGGPWHEYVGPFRIEEEGIQTLEYFSEDDTGDQEAPRQREIRVDTTPPVTTLVVEGEQGNEGWFITPVSAWLLPADAASGALELYFRVNDGPWGDLPFRLEFSRSGLYRLEFFAKDLAGNEEVVQARSLAIDTGAPAVTIVTPSAGAQFGESPVEVSWVSQDDLSGIRACSIALDGNPAVEKAETSAVLDNLAAGTHTLTVACLDAAGNMGSASVQFAVGSSPPTPSGLLSLLTLLLVLLAAASLGVGVLLLRRFRPRRSRADPVVTDPEAGEVEGDRLSPANRP